MFRRFLLSSVFAAMSVASLGAGAATQQQRIVVQGGEFGFTTYTTTCDKKLRFFQQSAKCQDLCRTWADKSACFASFRKDVMGIREMSSSGKPMVTGFSQGNFRGN